MEQKWDVVFHREGDPHASFTRAWTGQLWCVLPVDLDTGTCTELFVDSSYMEMLDRRGATHEVIALFELVLRHVVFKRPLDRPFVFGEPESMELWHWLGSCCVPAAQRPPPQ